MEIWKVTTESIADQNQSVNQRVYYNRIVENVTRVPIINEPVSRFVQGIVLQSSTCR